MGFFLAAINVTIAGTSLPVRRIWRIHLSVILQNPCSIYRPGCLRYRLLCCLRQYTSRLKSYPECGGRSGDNTPEIISFSTSVRRNRCRPLLYSRAHKKILCRIRSIFRFTRKQHFCYKNEQDAYRSGSGNFTNEKNEIAELQPFYQYKTRMMYESEDNDVYAVRRPTKACDTGLGITYLCFFLGKQNVEQERAQVCYQYAGYGMQSWCTRKIVHAQTEKKSNDHLHASVNAEREPQHKQEVKNWFYKLVQWRHFIEHECLYQDE